MASVLMLTPQVPYPPRQGTALRNWGLLKGLAAHHQISLLTFASPDQAATPDPVLAQAVERVAILPQPSRTLLDRLRDLVSSPLPDLAQRLASAPFRATLDDWLTRHRFDWVLIEGLEMAPYAACIAAQSRMAAGSRIAFDDHNCEYLLQRRAARSDWRKPSRWPGALYSSIQWRRLRRYEAEICTRADVVIAVSAADAAALRAVIPTLEPLVIPNGIDVAAYAGFDQALDGGETVVLTQPAFVFTGTMDFRPNVDGVIWFANDVWPRIRQALPEAHFYIVGRRPHSRLDTLRKHPGITITGSLPDTRPHIRAAAVYVVPLLVGGGTRLKLLESTAMGKAVVATSLASEGFVAPERAMVLADTAQEFAEACINLARDPDARATLGARARAYVEAYDWAELLPPLLAKLG